MDALRRIGLPQQYLDVITAIYKDLRFFVRDAWGESDLRPQAEGLRQGDPLACFLLLILMTVIMLDTRKAFEAICTEKNFSAAAHYMERVFGFHDIEFADDTNFVHTHLLSLRTLTTCYLKEALIYGFRVNNDPETGKCYVLALNPDLPQVVIRDLNGQTFPVVDEAVTLGMTYGLAFGTASIIFRMRISKMQNAMDQYRLVWQSDLSVKAKTEKMNALVWNKGRWSLHLFPLLPALQQKIDAAQARYLRRILKLPAAYISRISHKEVRRRCGTYRFSTFIFRAQLRWLGNILREPATDPLRRVLFAPNSPLNPHRPPSLNPNRPTRQRVGRPQTDWAKFLLLQIFRLSRTDRATVTTLAQDRSRYHLFVERLCSLFDRI